MIERRPSYHFNFQQVTDFAAVSCWNSTNSWCHSNE